MQPWLIALIAVIAVIFVLFLLAVLADAFAFGRRADKNPLITYFTGADFNLTEEKFTTGKLSGIIYSDGDQKNKPVVVFVHGMGPGHIAYTTEIAYFCRHGFTVVAADSLGCNLSAGRNIKGMYEGVNSAVKAIDFAKARFPESETYLVGHSWGGYSALCASARRKVCKVIAIAAPKSPVKTVYCAASRLLGKPLAAILCPFWYIINFFKFGAKGNSSAVKCARKNGTPTLIIHGDSDGVVTPESAAYYGVYGENVTKFSAQGKAHNPYNTKAAEAKLKELSSLLRERKPLADFDFKAATEEDEEVMQIMYKFLSRN